MVVLVHLALWTLGLAVSLQLRFDGSIAEPYRTRAPLALVVLFGCRLVTFYAGGLFHGLWRYAGLPELKNLVQSTTIASLAFVLFGTMIHAVQMPRSVYVGEWLAAIVLVGGVRFAIRMFKERQRPRNPLATATLIIGASDEGESLLRDVQRNSETKWEIVGFLDDDPIKRGASVRDVRVLGPADEATLRRQIEDLGVKLVVLAISDAPGKRIREVLGICRRLGVQTKTIPTLSHRMTNGEIDFGSVREVSIDDLLRREPVKLDVEQVESLIEGRTLLVTGAGGSIGSELVRQALWFKPNKILLFDHDENALYQIERELRASELRCELVVLIGDITDRERVDGVFRRHRPEVVLHAAAHKHVPMMEKNVSEAVKNNVFGTQMVADAAHAYGSEVFAMISTDKAVNPTSIMGASKRVAEMLVQARAASSTTTRYVAVRFGNVLGSAGSVVPLFREQIGRGGPITVTHPDMRRYFMTIPEAAQLVLQAGALAGGGEIFVLDMGEPIKIVDLARDMIELSGLRPDIDVSIEFTGLRPGEKLFEELLLTGEAFDKTPHPKIVVGRIQPTSADQLKRALAKLRSVADAGDDAAARSCLAELVPEATLSIVLASPDRRASEAIESLVATA